MEKLKEPDRISRLPEDTLLVVLSRLPTRCSARTALLSNRWRNLYTFIPVLDFLLRSHTTTSLERFLDLLFDDDKEDDVTFVQDRRLLLPTVCLLKILTAGSWFAKVERRRQKNEEFLVIGEEGPEPKGMRDTGFPICYLQSVTLFGFSKDKNDELQSLVSCLTKASPQVNVSKALPCATHEQFIPGVLSDINIVSSTFRSLSSDSDEDDGRDDDDDDDDDHKDGVGGVDDDAGGGDYDETTRQPEILHIRSTMETMNAPDRISLLPKEILRIILSYLPTRYAIQTSVVSKRWRKLYTLVPVLDFLVDCHNSTTSLQQQHFYNISQSLCLRSKLINLQKLHIELAILPEFPSHFREFCSHIRQWITFSTERNVTDLRLQICNEGGFLNLPNCLFSCNSLSLLELRFSVFKPPIGFSGFCNLKYLKLFCVRISDQSMSSILLKCPFLENLALHGCHGLGTLNVTTPQLRLKHLDIFLCLSLKELTVDAPSLRIFTYDGIVIKLCLGSVPHLDEACLLFRDQAGEIATTYLQDWRLLVTTVSQVKILTVGSWFSKFAWSAYEVSNNQHTIFPNLTELRWWDDLPSAEPLKTILGDCPLLAKVDIDIEYRRYVSQKFDIVGEDHPEPKGMSQNGFPLCYLKAIKMKDFSGNANEMDMVAFLLNESMVLEEFRLISSVEDVNELQSRVSCLTKASPLAEVIVSKDPPRAAREEYLRGVYSRIPSEEQQQEEEEEDYDSDDEHRDYNGSKL